MPAPQHPDETSARLFLALLPDASVGAALALHRDHWQWSGSEHLYAREDWHVTLHFMRSVARHRLTELRAGLKVTLSPFALHFGQPECWPHGLAVLCPTVVPSTLQQLHTHLGQALQRLELPIDARPYRPHVTLARHASAALVPTQCPEFVWPVNGYALMESISQAPPRYRVIQGYALTSP